ncbi:D-alanyl-D-alanine carboxypeptidase/D-alanyl-D-alanine-endopeptidase [Rheinheimera sp. 4Y26]|uniref:D-alanyl-D-alanine carboxypeptidase/D-alanyl-D-alanine-endopeptidase n=1 Tax=Rheinheimera sp. 4Y26 TaxID=2977811 RepID=UPI0021B0CB45|nr:D-alanyl-D-alanine carboxypeptidase [Rheinheimera sp. 4Y26]MCT6700767.1 D-alanyl-D-alanine carboxypeptidase [Rheinheimera sp. 4Y26]
MKLLRHRLYLPLSLLLLTLSACSSAPISQQGFKSQLAQNGLQPEEVALVMEPLFDGAAPFFYRADAAMSPASTMKLLTSTVVLSRLGADWRGSTRLLLDKDDYAALQRHKTQTSFRLTQPLYLQAGADADLNYAELSALLSQLRAQGVSELNAIVLDRSSFLPARSDVGAADFDETPKARYNHRPDALYLGQSQQVLKLSSDQQKVQAMLLPYWPLLQLDLSGVTLNNSPCEQTDLTSIQAQLVMVSSQLQLQLRGNFAKNCVQQQSFELIDRDQALFLTLLQQWQQLGGTIRGNLSNSVIDGDIAGNSHSAENHRPGFGHRGKGATTTKQHCCQAKHHMQHLSSSDKPTPLLATFSPATWLQQGQTPPDAVPVAVHYSRRLGELVRRVNKTSDNALTRLLYLTLGANRADNSTDNNTENSANKPDNQNNQDNQDSLTTDLAAQEILAWLAEQQITSKQLVLENGSGLSRQERLSASLLAALLRHNTKAHYGPEFIASLPLAGMDGTLKNRFRAGAAYQKARLKTGTLNNVTALAGYVYDANHRPWIFVAMVNSPKAATAGRTLLDQLVQQLAQYPGKR